MNLYPTDQQEAPVYEALSYMWGPPHPTTEIFVNDSPFQIRQNLFAALKELRYKYFPRCLWVDAICINQTDNPERGAQVSIMSQVFRAATKVLVWLGPASENSDMAFELLTSVEGQLGFLHKMAVNWTRAGVDVAQHTKDQVEVALLSLCLRPYWRRLWIIQEILSASSVDILCGSKALRWDDFWTGIQVIANVKIITSGPKRACVSTAAYAIAKKASAHSQSYSMEELIRLCSTCQSECEDIRDRIFGLLSLAKDFNILPDYSKSEMEIYIDVARAHHAAHNTLGFGKDDFLDIDDALYCTFIPIAGYLLGNPLWDLEGGKTSTTYALQQIPVPHQIISEHIEERVYALNWVVQVGPVITAGTPITNSTNFQFDGTPPRALPTPERIRRYLSAFTTKEFHQTAFIGDKYISADALDKSFIQDEKSTRVDRLSHDGQCRPFVGLGGVDSDFGIASSAIQVGDLLCCVPCFGFCIIRPADKPRMTSFNLISRASCKYASSKRNSGLGVWS